MFAFFRNPKHLLVLAVLLASQVCSAQVEFKEPFYTHRDNVSMSIGKVTVKPRSIVFQLEYNGGGAWDLLYNTSYYNFLAKPYLQIIGAGNFSLTDGTVPPGVPASRYDHYSGPAKTTSPPKKKTMMVEFPFNSGKMFFNIFNDRYLKYDNSLYLNFAECAVKNPVKEWTPACINFKNIMLPFTQKQLQVLYLHNYIDGESSKGEFETTEAFQARTHPDSLYKELSRLYQALEDVFQDQFHSRVSGQKPTLRYNADKQQFTVMYAGHAIDPIIIAVPLTEAETFKNDLLNGTTIIDNWKFVRKSEDQFLITHLEVWDKKTNRKTYGNLAAGSSEPEGAKLFRKAVFREVQKLLPKGKSWTYSE